MMKTAILAAIFGLFASSASAALINFDFTDSTNTVPTYSATAGGFAVTATPTTDALRINSSGIGVTTNPEGGRLGAGETIVFTAPLFDALTIAIWETGNQDEDFRVTINGTSYDFTIAGGGRGASTVTFDLTSLLPSGGTSIFSVTGLEPNASGNRGVRVASVSINVVPLPAGAALLLTALLGFGAIRRRR